MLCQLKLILIPQKGKYQIYTGDIKNPVRLGKNIDIYVVISYIS